MGDVIKSLAVKLLMRKFPLRWDDMLMAEKIAGGDTLAIATRAVEKLKGVFLDARTRKSLARIYYETAKEGREDYKSVVLPLKMAFFDAMDCAGYAQLNLSKAGEELESAEADFIKKWGLPLTEEEQKLLESGEMKDRWGNTLICRGPIERWWISTAMEMVA
jgi:hypothetical protein